MLTRIIFWLWNDLSKNMMAACAKYSTVTATTKKRVKWYSSQFLMQGHEPVWKNKHSGCFACFLWFLLLISMFSLVLLLIVTVNLQMAGQDPSVILGLVQAIMHIQDITIVIRSGMILIAQHFPYCCPHEKPWRNSGKLNHPIDIQLAHIAHIMSE